MIPLILAALFTVQAERVVAVVVHPDKPTVTITVTEAERQLRATDDVALRSALVRALGSIGEGDHEPQLTRQERERFRWHRRPTQRAKG